MRSGVRRNYWPLLVVLVVAVVPVAAAMLSYFGGVALPDGKVNSGQLVLDQPPLQRWQLTTASGERWHGQGRWQLLLVVQRCQQDCQQWQHLLGQVKRSLGRDRHRVQPQLVLPEHDADQQALASPRATVIDPGVWLADPLGNLVLHYRLDQPPQDLIKDLKRLLKVSKVG